MFENVESAHSPQLNPAPASRRGHRWAILVVFAVVVLIYGLTARNARWPSEAAAPDDYYALLADGFASGQLSLAKPVPPEFLQLANPYDATANARFRGWRGLHDMSYFKGRLYLYFGATPVLVLILPWELLFGAPLPQEFAVAIFCAVGFAAAAWLFCALCRRFFSETGIGVKLFGVLALGFASGVMVLLATPNVYEVAIAAAYAMVMLTLAALWRAWEQPRWRALWLALASLAYGLAVASRPSLLPGAVILSVPVLAEFFSGSARSRIATLASAFGPIFAIGLGLMLYNALRFENPFEFGHHYQLAGNNQLDGTTKSFSAGFVGFNWRLYFLEPVQWSDRFPFVSGIRPPTAVPKNYLGVENPFGVLASLPLTWFAAAVVLAWRKRSAEDGRTLRRFLLLPALLFGTGALVVGFFGGACARYELEFLPALVLLALVGILGIERFVAANRSRRIALRCAWVAALFFSVANAALVGFGPLSSYPSLQNNMGYALLDANQIAPAIPRFRAAVLFRPNFAQAHANLGYALFQSGDFAGAVESYSDALRLTPIFPDAENSLGVALIKAGRPAEAKIHFERALRMRPNFPDALANLRALEQPRPPSTVHEK